MLLMIFNHLMCIFPLLYLFGCTKVDYKLAKEKNKLLDR